MKKQGLIILLVITIVAFFSLQIGLIPFDVDYLIYYSVALTILPYVNFLGLYRYQKGLQRRFSPVAIIFIAISFLIDFAEDFLITPELKLWLNASEMESFLLVSIPSILKFIFGFTGFLLIGIHLIRLKLLAGKIAGIGFISYSFFFYIVPPLTGFIYFMTQGILVHYLSYFSLIISYIPFISLIAFYSLDRKMETTLDLKSDN